MKRCSSCGRVFAGGSCPFCGSHTPPPQGLSKLGWDTDPTIDLDHKEAIQIKAIEKILIEKQAQPVIENTYNITDSLILRSFNMGKECRQENIKESILQGSYIRRTTCSNCGQKLQETDRFCTGCGVEI